MAGPSKDGVRMYLDSVATVTTDMGVEMLMCSMPDVIDAFFVNMETGAPLETLNHLVDPHTRLLKNCLRIPGWSHICGNIMSQVAARHPRWNFFLEHMRALTRYHLLH